MWAALGSVAGAALSAKGDAAGESGALSSDYINVAPVGVNFGAIMQPFNEGAPTNGGYGLQMASRYRGSSNKKPQTSMPTEKAPVFNMPMLCMAGMGCLAVYYFMQ